MGDNCSFCRNPRSKYNCQPGRCSAPMAGMEVKPAAPAKVVAVRPLGPKRLVVAQEVRSGPNGGLILVLELECGCVIWQRSGKRPRKVKDVQCFSCAETIQVACAGGCGAIGDQKKRVTSWVLWNRAWWCLKCFVVHVCMTPEHGSVSQEA